MKPITAFFAPKKKRVAPDEGNAVTAKRSKVDPSGKDDATSTHQVSKALTDNKSSGLDLLQHLHEASWKEVLEKRSQSYSSLKAFVARERKAKTIFPTPEDTFSALNSMPRSSVRVVIVGQDPYHQPGQAHGLSFSVRKGVRTPPSLLNIYKELKQDANVTNFTSIPNHGYLQRWADQGVLLLNTVLTVRRGEANSHKKQGWERVTDDILAACPEKVVFLLWGKPAQAKAERFVAAKPKSVVIATSHPSPLGATKTKQPFMGSRCFSRCNEALVKMGHDPIDWNVDGPLRNRYAASK